MNANGHTTEALARHHDVAVVGAGTIGISWAGLFLAHDLRVRIYDTRPDVADYVAAGLEQTKPALDALGLPTTGWDERLVFAPSLADAVTGATAIQENGPESLDVKREMFASIEAVVDPRALILSSTSSIPASDLAVGMRHPERLLVGHPFN